MPFHHRPLWTFPMIASTCNMHINEQHAHLCQEVSECSTACWCGKDRPIPGELHPHMSGQRLISQATAGPCFNTHARVLCQKGCVLMVR